ncbi:Vitamin B12 ABC transporter, B12-binding component BtuF [hydrothermal vent metagenome]|uniref:Vitamin B12 ABC transporter, B12-binding component BtuF n=1 Tax=hydrothermal vent metagenome TaxID=652676 RepID=A0A1W1D1A6_9ZZZZ
MGAGESVVGNTQYSLHPPASQSVAKVGGYFSPSLEKILILQPTLVLMQPNNTKLAKQLKKLSIPSKILAINRLPHITQAIKDLGKILNKEDKAKTIVSQIHTALEDIKGIVSNKKILIVIGHNTSLVKHIFVVGQNLYLDDIINASGNTNALQSTRKGQPILNQENLIATNPDIVILLAHSMHQRGLSKDDLISPWLRLPINASKTKDIYIIDKDYSGIPSDRLILFLRDFRGILLKIK